MLGTFICVVELTARAIWGQPTVGRNGARSGHKQGSASPKIVLVFSGKRKTGKDYVTDLLLDRLGCGNAEIMRLSGPLKKQYAIDHGLDLAKLLSASSYKEKYRADMILWGESKRNADPGYFARLITASASKPIWIVSDARRPTDVQYFKERYNALVIRVEASDAIRSKRGWVFTSGVDDVESECALDFYEHDMVVKNEGDTEVLEKQLHNIVKLIHTA